MHTDGNTVHTDGNTVHSDRNTVQTDGNTVQKPSAKDHSILLNGVEIRFSWFGDRWSHTIAFPGVGGDTAWRSVEGPDEAGGDAAWPASPVIVELSPVPSAAAVVGVGRAGRSHYSVSFTAKPAGSVTAKPADSVTAKPAGSSIASHAARLVVECACRIHEPPRWIGSTYEVVGSAGRSAGLIRIPAVIAADLAGSLPRTVTWSYVFEPTGPVPCQRPG